MGERTQAGYLAREDADLLSVVVLHESYGLFSPLSNVPEVCDRLAAAGFQSLAPDLYDGRTAAPRISSTRAHADLRYWDSARVSPGNAHSRSSIRSAEVPRIRCPYN